MKTTNSRNGKSCRRDKRQLGAISVESSTVEVKRAALEDSTRAEK